MVETMGTLRLDLARFTLLASAVGFSFYQEDNFDSPVNKVQICWSFFPPPILTLEKCACSAVSILGELFPKEKLLPQGGGGRIFEFYLPVL